MREAGAATPIFSARLYRGGECTLWPDAIAINDRRFPLEQIARASLISEASITVPRGSPPWPAAEVELRDGRRLTLIPADPLDAWHLLEQLYTIVPALRTPLPIKPGRAAWRGGYTSIPGSYAYMPSGGEGGVPAGSSDAILAGIAHLSFFFAPILLPLGIWLLSRDRAPYAARQGRQAFFFHLAFAVVAFLLVVVWGIVLFFTAGALATNADSGIIAVPAIAFFVIAGVLGVLSVYAWVLAIYAAVQGFRGVPFSYPLLSRL
jgi:uncharacterized Tic20 family protein